VEVIAVQEAIITAVFADLALVKARLAGIAGVRIESESFTETGAVIKASLPEATAAQTLRMITDVTSGRADIRVPSR
jgi:putative IMPACT (imprinted ancient) family translation regulator